MKPALKTTYSITTGLPKYRTDRATGIRQVTVGKFTVWLLPTHNSKDTVGHGTIESGIKKRQFSLRVVKGRKTLALVLHPSSDDGFGIVKHCLLRISHAERSVLTKAFRDRFGLKVRK